jgi:hypothetical protein
MNLAKQKLIFEYLMSSDDLYARCASIISSSYFDIELRKAVAYVEDYYTKYSVLPKQDRIKAEFDLDLELKQIDQTDLEYISAECEHFAKSSAIKEAIKEGMKDLANDNFDKVTQRILDAAMISMDRDVGIDLYQQTEEHLLEAAVSAQTIPTGIRVLDEKLDGGCARKELTLFSANSGVGKSVLMSNLGDNYAAAGYHVVYLSLELSELKVLSRLASIATGVGTKDWKANIPKISAKVRELAALNGGSYVIKRLKMGATANDIRAYLKRYELVYKRKPDVIIVDYLDVMSPIGGISGMSVSEQDKAKSEQLYEIGVDYDAILFSASQQNRDGVKQNSPDQTVIAGGFNKINVVDNYISIYMTPAMRLEGTMLLYFLKTRSSSGIGQNVPVKFNSDNLQITDVEDENKIRAIITRLTQQATKVSPFGKKKENKDEAKKEQAGYSVIKDDIPGLPMEIAQMLEDDPPVFPDEPDEVVSSSNTEEVECSEDEGADEELLNLMKFIHN